MPFYVFKHHYTNEIIQRNRPKVINYEYLGSQFSFSIFTSKITSKRTSMRTNCELLETWRLIMAPPTLQ